MAAPPMSVCAGMQQVRLQPWCRCPCCMAVGPLTSSVSHLAKGFAAGGLATRLILLSNPPLPQCWESLLASKSTFSNHYSLALVGLWRCQQCLKTFLIWRVHYGLFSKLGKHCFPSSKLSSFLRTSWHLKIKLMHSCLPANTLCIQFFRAGTYLRVHERSMCVKPVCAPARVRCELGRLRKGSHSRGVTVQAANERIPSLRIQLWHKWLQKRVPGSTQVSCAHRSGASSCCRYSGFKINRIKLRTLEIFALASRNFMKELKPANSKNKGS